MTKSNLRTGHVVTLRDGTVYRVYIDAVTSTCLPNEHCDILTNGVTWTNLKGYNEDLTHHNNSERDIVKVQQVRCKIDLYSVGNDCIFAMPIWEREEKKKMTVAEIEAILGYGVEIVSDK